MKVLLWMVSILLLSPVVDAHPPWLPRTGPYGSWIEEAKLTAYYGGVGDSFGSAVALLGNVALVGAPDNSLLGFQAGAAYLFGCSSGSWGPHVGFFAGGEGNHQGRSVALCGGRALIGQPGPGVGFWPGYAHVFVRSASTWDADGTFTASDGQDEDLFGTSASLSGDRALVGAVGDDDGAPNAGSAYVFRREDAGWVQEAKLAARFPSCRAAFGTSVSLDGDTALIGRPDGTVAHGTGSAYVFVRSGTTWTEQAELVASDAAPGDQLGWSVSLSGDTAVVGMWHDASKGAAYVFVRSGSSWHQEAKLEGSDSELGDYFGGSVAVWGDRALVGAPGQDAAGVDSGAVYVFEREGTSWSERAKLVGADTEEGDDFGAAVALSGRRGLIGARGDGGDQDWGSAYVFTNLHPVGTGFCFGDPGSGTPCPCDNDNDGSVPGSGCDNGVFASGARLVGIGSASVTEDALVLHTTHQEPNNSGIYFQGDTDLSPGIVWGDGLRCAGDGVVRLEVRFADAAGTSSTTIGIASKGGVSAGGTKYYQLWYRTKVAPPCGVGVNDFNTTNGYAVTWTP